MPRLLNSDDFKQEGRRYQRLEHTGTEINYLTRRGFRAVISSNVSAIAEKDGILYVRFHGGATYAYPDSGDLFEAMVLAPSKGEFVWDKLRRAGVQYYKVGNINLKDDVEDRDLMKPSLTRDEATSLSDLLLGAVVSTILPSDVVLGLGIIVGLDLASEINESRQA